MHWPGPAPEVEVGPEPELEAAFGAGAGKVVEPALGPAVADEAVEQLEWQDWSVVVAEAGDVVVGLVAGLGLGPGSMHEIGVDPALALHAAGTVEMAVVEEGNTVAAGKDHIPHIADNTADIVVDTTDLVLA